MLKILDFWFFGPIGPSRTAIPWVSDPYPMDTLKDQIGCHASVAPKPPNGSQSERRVFTNEKAGSPYVHLVGTSPLCVSLRYLAYCLGSPIGPESVPRIGTTSGAYYCSEIVVITSVSSGQSPEE